MSEHATHVRFCRLLRGHAVRPCGRDRSRAEPPASAARRPTCRRPGGRSPWVRPTTRPSTRCTPTSGPWPTAPTPWSVTSASPRTATWSASTTGASTARRTGAASCRPSSSPSSTELDWGSWRDTWEDFEDPEMPDRDRSQILTLRRLLEAVAAAGPPGRGGDRDQAPDAVRRAGRAPARRPARRVRLGRRPGSPVRVMSSPSCRCAGCAHLAPDLRSGDALRAGAAAVPGRLAARGRRRRRAQHRDRAGAPALRRALPPRRATRSTSGPSTTARTSTCACELGVEAIITNRPGRRARDPPPSPDPSERPPGVMPKEPSRA